MYIDGNHIRSLAKEISNNVKEIREEADSLSKLLNQRDACGCVDKSNELYVFLKLHRNFSDYHSENLRKMVNELLKVAEMVDAYNEPKTIDLGNKITEKELNEAYK